MNEVTIFGHLQVLNIQRRLYFLKSCIKQIYNTVIRSNYRTIFCLQITLKKVITVMTNVKFLD